MCTIINSEDVLMRSFNALEEKKLSFKQLNEIRERIENEIENVYVDVTFSSLRKVVIKYQDYLGINQEGIYQKQNQDDMKFSDYHSSFDNLRDIFFKIKAEQKREEIFLD
jgi:hypothetical protein